MTHNIQCAKYPPPPGVQLSDGKQVSQSSKTLAITFGKYRWTCTQQMPGRNNVADADRVRLVGLWGSKEGPGNLRRWNIKFECQIFEGKFRSKKTLAMGNRKNWTCGPIFLHILFGEKNGDIYERKNLRYGVSRVGVWLTTNQNDLNNLSTQQSGLELVQGRIYSGGVCNDDGTQSSGKEVRFEENGEKMGSGGTQKKVVNEERTI